MGRPEPRNRLHESDVSRRDGAVPGQGRADIADR
jgi:hypothetical protein